MSATNPLAGLLGRNPFSALQKHMSAVIETVEHVPELFNTLVAGDYDALAAVRENIDADEARADKVKHKLREHLPRWLFLPVDRRDLLEMLDLQDSIADVAQDIAELLVARQMSVHPAMRDQLMALVKQSVDVCLESGSIIAELDELLAVGFGGQEAERVEERINRLNKAEDEADRMEIELRKRLFTLESEIDPVSVMFWYRLIDLVGDLADYAEKVANRLRLMIAR